MTEGLRSITALPRESLRGIKPGNVAKIVPEFLWIDPRTLFVEETYQREIGENGIALIRRIYETFDWARFKTPICVRRDDLDGILVCIDGQHTAIASATHPDIATIPVMVVQAQTTAARAAAFVGHNRDRVALTAQMIYRGELACGDPEAVAVDQACQEAGAKVLDKAINLRDRQPVGSTIAIGTMKVIARRLGQPLLVSTLKTLVAAGRGPIKAGEIQAAATILASRPDVADRLVATIKSKSAESWAALAATRAAETGEKLGSAISAAWCRDLDIRLNRKIKAEIKKEPPAKKPEPRFDPAVHKQAAQAALQAPVVRQPAPALPKPPPTPPAAPAAPAPAQKLVRNGIEIDLDRGILTHRRKSVHLSQEATRLVAALAAVMPALLDGGRLASNVFGSQHGIERLRNMIPTINPILQGVRLEIRSVKNIGINLYDLGP